MGVYNVGEGGLGQTYGPTAQLIAAYVVLRRPIAIGVAPNCISKRLGNRTPGGRDRALFTPDSQPIAVQLPAGPVLPELLGYTRPPGWYPGSVSRAWWQAVDNRRTGRLTRFYEAIDAGLRAVAERLRYCYS